MILLEGGLHVLYVCSPYVTTVRELLDRRLHLGDLPLHDGTRDLILLNQSRMSQVELKLVQKRFSFCKVRICFIFESGKENLGRLINIIAI